MALPTVALKENGMLFENLIPLEIQGGPSWPSVGCSLNVRLLHSGFLGTFRLFVLCKNPSNNLWPVKAAAVQRQADAIPRPGQHHGRSNDAHLKGHGSAPMQEGSVEWSRPLHSTPEEEASQRRMPTRETVPHSYSCGK